MKRLRTLALATLPVLFLSLTACGGKKKAPKPADKPAAAPVAKEVAVDDATKGALTAEYKAYDEKNACWLAKTADGEYCMAANKVSTTFRDTAKTKLTYIMLESKGKMLNGAPDATAEGGIGLFLINQADNSIVAKMPFAKAWDKGSIEHSLMQMPLGKEIEGLYVYDTAKKDNITEIRKLRVFGLDGRHFRQMMDIRITWADNSNKAEFNRSGTDVTSEDAASGEYKTIILKTSGYQKAKFFEERTFQVPFNKAKHQYDVPAEYRRLMGE